MDGGSLEDTLEDGGRFGVIFDKDFEVSQFAVEIIDELVT